MKKSIKIIKESERNLTSCLDELKNKEMIFRKLRKDTVGQSSSNPTWGYAYNVKKGKMKFKAEGLYKEHDYDAPQASYSEKIASIMGAKLLAEVRVPEIDVVEETKNQPGIISYKLMDNDKEDMFHIRDLMFYKYERDELSKKKNIFSIEDILECIRIQVKDDENYKTIEKGVIKTLLLDSIINNGDRHNNNWALVRNKDTNKYDLAIFDHSSCFTDMIQEQRHFTYEGWVGSYIKVKEDNNAVRRSSLGKEIIQYIAQNYTQYFNEFVDDFDKKLPEIIEEIKQEELPINMARLEMKLHGRKSFLNKVKDKEELEYE